MAAPRRRNSYVSRVAQNTQAQLQAKLSTFAASLARDWAALTWRADSTKIGPLSITAWNWILVAGLAAAGHFLPGQRLIVAGIAGFWLMATLIRAGYVMPRRRAALQAIYDQLRDRAGLPAGTAARPAAPEKSLTAITWGAGQTPSRFTLTIGGKCPAASSTILRPILEAEIEDQVVSPLHPNGDWMFTWPAKNTVTCVAVPAGGPDLIKKTIERRIIGALRASSAFNITPATAITESYALTIDEWSDETRADGETVPFPVTMTFHTGHRDLTDPGFRDTIERVFDRSVGCPGEWIYTWNIDSGQLVIRRVDKTSLEASRKLNERKFADDVRSAVTRPGKDPIVADVTVWADEDSDQPKELTVNFGTLPLGERSIRDRFEDSLDSSVQSRWPDLRLLFDWQFHGGTTALGITAVDHTDELALRKAVEKKLRNVVESKFGKAKSPVDCDILEWQEQRAANGAALPLVARVNFGAVDVTKAETRDYFQMHWDSLTTDNDWHYAWNTTEGIVTMTAVPPLPEQLAFPAPETPEFDEAMRLARRGILRFGPQKGGGWLDWNLNDCPHGLIGGKTGSGKSVALSIVLFYALHNPDLFEIVVCDPKRTDFTWTPEFPSVVRFAATDMEIVAAVAYVKAEMDARQSLLNRLQVRKIQWLRDKYEQQPELAAENGPAPKRLILFFDEIADFLAKGANSDIEELKDEARADLESIGRLGRAMETNIVCAAQKPDAKIISTQLRSQLGFRLGVGPLDQYESQQILNSDHGTRFPEAGTPKGRAWGYDPTNGYRQVQTMFLPDDPMLCPWDSTIELAGTKQLVRDHLRELGYSEVTFENKDGGLEPRWVPVEMDDDASEADPQPAPGDGADADEVPEVAAVEDGSELTAGIEQPAAAGEPAPVATEEVQLMAPAPELRLVPLDSPRPKVLEQESTARLAAVAVGVDIDNDGDDPWA